MHRALLLLTALAALPLSRAQAQRAPIPGLREGVRIELDLELPAGTDASNYRFDLRGPAGSPGDSVSPPSHGALIPGERLSVRCHSLLPPSPGQLLFVVSMLDSRAWRGRIPERLDGPLEMEALECGALRGLVRAPKSSRKLQDRSTVLLSFERQGHPRGPRVLRHYAPVGKPFRIHWIEAGQWKVRVGPPYFAEVHGSVKILPGKESTLNMTLGRPRPLGDLRLRVIDGRGDVPEWKGWHEAPDVWAMVQGVDWNLSRTVKTSSMCGFGIHTWFERKRVGGRWVLEAVLEDLPVGPYRVTLMSEDRRVAPESLEVRPGAIATFHLLRP